jgi:hypothetical protein
VRHNQVIKMSNQILRHDLLTPPRIGRQTSQSIARLKFLRTEVFDEGLSQLQPCVQSPSRRSYFADRAGGNTIPAPTGTSRFAFSARAAANLPCLRIAKIDCGARAQTLCAPIRGTRSLCTSTARYGPFLTRTPRLVTESFNRGTEVLNAY